jgi:hypothetical protein
LEKYVNVLDDSHVLIVGLGHNHGRGKFPYYLHLDKNVMNWYKQNKKLYYFDFEEGSSFYAPFLDRNFNLAPFENMCTKIFSICKLTTDFVNNHFNTNKRFAIPFFFSEDFIKTDDFNKTIDVIYTGNYSNSKYVPINDIYETIKKYNYCWIGGDKSNYNAPTYENKIDMYAKSKIAEATSVMDGKALAEAQEMWYDARQRVDALENIKQQAATPKDRPIAPDRQMQRMAFRHQEYAGPDFDRGGRGGGAHQRNHGVWHLPEVIRIGPGARIAGIRRAVGHRQDDVVRYPVACEAEVLGMFGDDRRVGGNVGQDRKNAYLHLAAPRSLLCAGVYPNLSGGRSAHQSCAGASARVLKQRAPRVCGWRFLLGFLGLHGCGFAYCFALGHESHRTAQSRQRRAPRGRGPRPLRGPGP